MLNNLKCIGCEYALRGLHPNGKCPECGLPIFDSIAGESSAKLHTYEEKLLARTLKYQARRGHVYGLAFAQSMLAVAIGIGILRRPDVSDTQVMVFLSCLFAVPFWLLLAHLMHARVKHIESIEQSRKQLAKAYRIEQIEKPIGPIPRT